jgi:hypothetical protein
MTTATTTHAQPPRPHVFTTKSGWEFPCRNDPRIPFAATLTLYAVLGFSFLGFNRSPWQMLAIVLSGSLLDVLLTYAFKGRKVFPLSAYISCCSLAILLNYSHASWVLLFPVLMCIGSKHAITFEGKHIYNPSMFGVATSLLLTNELITAAPAYQWAGGSISMSFFLVMVALLLFFVRIGKNWLVFSFLFFYALQTALRAYVMRHHIPPEMLFWGTVASPPFFLFTFYMITDPATSPKTPRGQVLFAFVLTLVDLWLHFKESVFTFFYAALIMGTFKFFILHGGALYKEGARKYFADRINWPTLKPIVAVAAMLLISVSSFRLFLQPALARNLTPPFRMERMTAERTGMHAEMSKLLEQVDPGLVHVAKWILSVGDAVAVGDYDGDGKLDLFFTNILKSPEDRNALYRNLGDFRFERVPLPEVERYKYDFKRDGVGLPAGATFVDYDGDGDQDLALAVGFGHSRLLQNQLSESGRAEFVDVSQEVGLSEQTVSLAIEFLDFDRDARLDMFVTNSVDPYLHDYTPARPLNIFDLPKPEYAGDRRMFRFMHDGWHDAGNGGPNTLYRALPGGKFSALDRKSMGLTDTHWSLAVSSADFNRDGFTDLYVASDFGPDDLYLNRRGTGFEHVVGKMFGDIGKDTYKGMNATTADFDRNGYMDVYVSNVHHSLQAEGSLLWMVRPTSDPFHPSFQDEATQRGALNERRFGWGAGAGDVDNDGFVDIVQANGMVDDRLDRRDDYTRKDYWYVNQKLMQSGPSIHTYADMWGDIRGRTIYPNEKRRLYMNLGARGETAFQDVADLVGIAEPDNSRGTALVDLDDDGDLDLVVTNQHGPSSIYRNTLRSGAGSREHHFVGLSLLGDGRTTHRTAVGSRVTIRYEENGKTVQQVGEVTVLGGFSAQRDPRVHFGLGKYHGKVQVTIEWYGGKSQALTVEPDTYYVVEQGGSVAQNALPVRPGGA